MILSSNDLCGRLLACFWRMWLTVRLCGRFAPFGSQDQDMVILAVISLLKGQGGLNLFPLNSGPELAVVSGFVGQETNDGHVYDTASKAWKPTLLTNCDLKVSLCQPHSPI